MSAAENERERSGDERDERDARDPASVRDKRPAWTVFRAALEKAGFRPSKRFGQNFLLDENMVRAIVRDARLEPGAQVLEIGAGCGFLSLHLVRGGARLLSVEIDPRLAEIARDLVRAEEPFELVVCDALDGKHALDPALDRRIAHFGAWHLVSNLPYSVAAPLLVLASEHENPPRSMTVLVQHEVALRIAARPASSAWGPLSIRLQLDYEPEITRSVPPSLFWPRPDVESSVVRLTRRADPLPGPERRALSILVGQLFQHRRQALGRALASIAGDRSAANAWLARAGRTALERAEDLDLEALRALSTAAPRLPT